MNELPFCKCGCGKKVTKFGNLFILGHNGRGEKLSQKTCDKISEGMLNSEAVKVKNERQRGVPHTTKRRTAISEGMLNSDDVKAAAEKRCGIPKSPEQRAAISESSLNSNAVKANCKRMRGGNDLVNHHYLYDHSDLSLNTVQMIRSDHTSLHNLFRKIGYVVPHININ